MTSHTISITACPNQLAVDREPAKEPVFYDTFSYTGGNIFVQGEFHPAGWEVFAYTGEGLPLITETNEEGEYLDDISLPAIVSLLEERLASFATES